MAWQAILAGLQTHLSRLSLAEFHRLWSLGRSKLRKVYQYSPLTSPTCTRVAVFQRLQSSQGPLELTLREIDLTCGDVKFIALSHAWGSNPIRDRPLLCDGKTLYVTAKLESALRRIQDNASPESRRHWLVIWVDAICIDQADSVVSKQEKAAQVAMMHKIFGSADEVIVDLRDAVSLNSADVEEMAEAISLARPYDPETLVELYHEVQCSLSSPEQVDTIISRTARSLVSIFRLTHDQEWASRLWCFQEFLLSRQVKFLIGEHVVDEASILRLFEEFGLLSSLMSGLPLFRSVAAMTFYLSTMQTYKNLWWTPDSLLSEGMRLEDVVLIGRTRQCSDERDVIYALHALLRRSPELIPIDYTESPSRLARRVAIDVLARGFPEAVLLGSVGMRRPLEADDSSWGWQLQVSNWLRWELDYCFFKPATAHAAGGPSSEVLLSVCPDHVPRVCLHAVGLVVDALGEICIPFPSRDRNGTHAPQSAAQPFNSTSEIPNQPLILSAWASRIFRVIKDYVKPRQGDEHVGIVDLWLILLKTFMHNANVDTTKPIPTDVLEAAVEAMREHIRILMIMVREMTGYIPDDDLSLNQEVARIETCLLDFDRHSVSEEAFPVAVQELVESYSLGAWRAASMAIKYDKLPERCVCVTTAGRIGTVPQCAIQGDLVVILRGISMPYILRPYQDKYRIVGYGKLFPGPCLVERDASKTTDIKQLMWTALWTARLLPRTQSGRTYI